MPEWRDEKGNLCIGIRPEAIKPASAKPTKEPEPKLEKKPAGRPKKEAAK